MRKNIWVLLAFSTMGFCMLTSCSKKAVVPPKQADKNAITVKPGIATTSQTPTTQHTCGGGNSNGSSSSSGGY